MRTRITIIILGLLMALPRLAVAGFGGAPSTARGVAAELPLSGPPDPGQWLDIAALLAAPAPAPQRDPLTDSFTYAVGQQHLTLVPGFSVIRFGSQTATLARPVIYYDGALFIAKDDSALFRQLVMPKPLPAEKQPVARTQPNPRGQLVVIDAGHGGRDTGAIANGICEKNINLRVAQYLKAALEARGFRVMLTRSDDTFIELDDRPDVANRCHADFFIAVHANSEHSGAITGVETFYCDSDAGRGPISTRSGSAGRTRTSQTRKSANVRSVMYAAATDSRQSRQLASFLQRGILDHVPADDRGIKPKALRVLRFADCPAALVEVGFLTNRQEARLLNDSSYEKRLAEGIADGLLKFAAR